MSEGRSPERLWGVAAGGRDLMAKPFSSPGRCETGGDDNIAVTGETTNLAACLQAQAGPGEILLSAEAHRRVADWLVDHGLGATEVELELKGFADPQAVHRLPADSAVGMASR
jgi:class 3 adenylate cyclase